MNKFKLKEFWDVQNCSQEDRKNDEGEMVEDRGAMKPVVPIEERSADGEIPLSAEDHYYSASIAGYFLVTRFDPLVGSLELAPHTCLGHGCQCCTTFPDPHDEE